jgi:NADH dehydrogenase
VCSNIRKRFPLTEEHLTNLKKLFTKYDKDNDGVLSVDDMKHMLGDIDKKMTSLPAVSCEKYASE